MAKSKAAPTVKAKTTRTALQPSASQPAVTTKRYPLAAQTIDLDELADKIVQKQLVGSKPAEDKIASCDKLKKASAVDMNMQFVSQQVQHLRSAIANLQGKLEPVLQVERDDEISPCSESEIGYEGNSTVSQFMRDTAHTLESLTASVNRIYNRVEV